MAHQQLEFYGFFHYTINTYTGKEWGDGTESPSLFFLEQFNPSQWVRAIKSAGMKGAILTCKHHDGFCLWPSRYTGHTIAASPYKNGAGDIVKEVLEACRREGLKFGVYLSPWDRNHPSYGQGKAYDDCFVNQLIELLTKYGEFFCVWLDGACGEGKNGKIQQYDWLRYYDTIRCLQPDACISVTGPDVRWCGNEAADTRKEEWSVVPAVKCSANAKRAFKPAGCDGTGRTGKADTGQILAVGTVIGYKKHIRLPQVKLKSLELVITMCRREAHILRVECY